MKHYFCCKETKAIDYKYILSIFFPNSMLDYFDFTNYSDRGDYYVFSLKERNSIPDKYSSLSLVSKRFYIEITITDFPVRDRTVYLKVKCRRWEDKQTDKI